ncbi:hypothetical protein [Streptomyces sp. NPDC058653]|uniref:hypothetical protein n=1 Tax=Streptomyces sp. NPDC058653 TaxID=3346576 RepID=UPI0036592A1A
MPTQENNTLKTQYAEQVAVDLERNTAEQERIRAEVASLQAQLSGLEQDHELLVGVRAALGGATVGASGGKSSAKAGSSSSPSARKTARKKTAAKSGRKAAPAGEKAAPLTELIHEYLKDQSEPRTAGEIAAALIAVHPHRNINDNLVRTTTERLVGRSRVERTKQGVTVHYTAAQQDDSATASAASDKELAPAEA